MIIELLKTLGVTKVSSELIEGEDPSNWHAFKKGTGSYYIEHFFEDEDPKESCIVTIFHEDRKCHSYMGTVEECFEYLKRDENFKNMQNDI